MLLLLLLLLYTEKSGNPGFEVKRVNKATLWATPATSVNKKRL
jgi:hypothetical protein